MDGYHPAKADTAAEPTIKVPRGTCAQLLAHPDRMSRADFLDQQDLLIEMVQSGAWQL